jgi:tRNA(Ile2) C34 agmatinyltransferase TiaS
MSSSQEELKSNIMARVEVVVAQALAAGEKPLTLTEIEERALAVRRQIEQAITAALVEEQVRASASELPTCPTCGRRMHPKGKKGRAIRTRSGEIAIQRPYFYCAHCRSGVFPPG